MGFSLDEKGGKRPVDAFGDGGVAHHGRGKVGGDDVRQDARRLHAAADEQRRSDRPHQEAAALYGGGRFEQAAPCGVVEQVIEQFDMARGVQADEVADARHFGGIGEDVRNPVDVSPHEDGEVGEHGLQVVAFTTAGADVQTELGEGFVVFVLQDFGDVGLFVGKEVMEHARAESRLSGEQAHRKLAVAVAGVEGFAGGDESVAGMVFCRVSHN